MAASNGQRRKFDIAIAALMSTRTIADAAVKSGIHYKTLIRWMKLLDFIERYNEAKSQLMTATVNKLRDVAFESVTELSAIAKNPGTSDAARVTALRTLLEFSFRGDEAEFIKARIDELEQKTNSSSDSQSGWISG
jgi:hypothetical protein